MGLATELLQVLFENLSIPFRIRNAQGPFFELTQNLLTNSEFLWFSSVPLGKFWDIVLNFTTVTSFYTF